MPIADCQITNKHFGLVLALLGLTLQSFWVSVVSPWTTLGRLRTSNSDQMALKCYACAPKEASHDSSPDSLDSSDSPELEQGLQLPTPLHSRRGLGWGELTKLPQIRIHEELSANQQSCSLNAPETLLRTVLRHGRNRHPNNTNCIWSVGFCKS